MSASQTSRRIFRKIAERAKDASKVECKPLKPAVYAEGGKSMISLVRAEDRERGILKALDLIGGITPALRNFDEGHILVKPNCNSHDPFPASTHPQTLRIILRKLMKAGVKKRQIVIGDMSGPAWLPTKTTMKKNGLLDVAKEFDVEVSFFEEEEWVWLKPEKSQSWPNGFRIAKTAYNASHIISLPCLKTHQFGGVFTLSLKNSVGLINPEDRSFLHKQPGTRIAEINLAYTPDLVLLDGLKCFVTGGPAQGDEEAPSLIVAGGDRVAVDAVGVTILDFYEAEGIKGIELKNHEQLQRAAEVGIGNLTPDLISLKTANLTENSEFDTIVEFINQKL